MTLDELEAEMTSIEQDSAQIKSRIKILREMSTEIDEERIMLTGQLEIAKHRLANVREQLQVEIAEHLEE